MLHLIFGKTFALGRYPKKTWGGLTYGRYCILFKTKKKKKKKTKKTKKQKNKKQKKTNKQQKKHKNKTKTQKNNK